MAFFPYDSFSQVIGRWPVFLPVLAFASPFMAIVVYLLGYSPKQELLVRARGGLVKRLGNIRVVILACLALAVATVVESVYTYWLVSLPDSAEYEVLMNGNLDTIYSETSQAPPKSSRWLIHLSSDAALEAKRFSGGSDDPTRLAIVRDQLLGYDRAFSPLWHRFLANRGLGDVAVARADHGAMVRYYAQAKIISARLEGDLAALTSRRQARWLFTMAAAERDSDLKEVLFGEAEAILLEDFSVDAQRILGSIYYIEQDYGRAFRIWRAVLERDSDASAGRLELPDPIERKMLANNIALAKLQLNQPRYALDVVEKGVSQPWDPKNESDRTEQIRLLATKLTALLAIGKPKKALAVFQQRRQLSVQLSEDGLSPGSALLKASILSEIWQNTEPSEGSRSVVAQQVFNLIHFAQDPNGDPLAFVDHSKEAYVSLLDDAESLWRWAGISFNRAGCEEAMLSLLK